MDLCAIGARIKAAREKAGMTQEDLAAALEMSPTHISVIERGVKAPKLETLVNIANRSAAGCETACSAPLWTRSRSWPVSSGS